jgi:hypothetical protein
MDLSQIRKRVSNNVRNTIRRLDDSTTLDERIGSAIRNPRQTWSRSNFNPSRQPIKPTVKQEFYYNPRKYRANPVTQTGAFLQRGLNASANNRINTPFSPQEADSSTWKALVNAGTNVLNSSPVRELPRQTVDMGNALGQLIVDDVRNIRPYTANSKAFQFAEDVVLPFKDQQARKQLKANPLKYGFNASGNLVGAFGPALVGLGLQNPISIAGQQALGTGINTIGALVSGEDKALKKGLNRSIQTVDKSLPMAGVLSKTSGFVNNVGKNLPTLQKLGVRSLANVGEGILIDKASDLETTVTSVAIDTLYPLGGEALSKAFKTAVTDGSTRLTQMPDGSYRWQKATGEFTFEPKYLQVMQKAGFNFTRDANGKIKQIDFRGAPINKSGQFDPNAKVELGKNTDPLLEEAKKYKSAEEFVKAQGRDTLIDIAKIKLGLAEELTKARQGVGEMGAKIPKSRINEKVTSIKSQLKIYDRYEKEASKLTDIYNKANAGTKKLTEGIDPMRATAKEQEELLTNAKIGAGKFNVGEIYIQRVLDNDRPILITKKNADGSVEGFYVGVSSPYEANLLGSAKSLQPAKWDNPASELNIPTRPQVETPKLKAKEKLGKLVNYSNEGENLIKNEIDRLKSQVGGVSIIKTGEDATGGGYRASSNPQWYKDFFAEYGRRPSEKQWRELAIKNLKTGELDGLFDNPEVLRYNKDVLSKPLDDIDRQINAKLITESDAKRLAKQTLSDLVNYSDDMAKSGYSPDVIERTSLNQYKKMIKSGSGKLPPIVKNDVKSTQLAVDKKVNLLDYMRTPDRVLKKIGLEKEANLLKQKYNDYLDELPVEIKKVTKWYEEVGRSKESSRKIFNYLDGQTGVNLDAKEQKVASEIQQYLKNWADRLGLPEDKRVSSYITHIFEKDFIRKEFDPEFEKMLVDSRNPAKSVYNPFLEQRKGKSGYVEDVFRALDAYVKRATRKANMDVALKELNEGAKGLDAQSLAYVKTLVDRVNLRPQQIDSLLDNFIKQIPLVRYKAGQRPTANITRKVRQWTYRGTLGLNFGSAVRNLTQGVNTYSQLGERWTTTGYIKAFRDITNGSDELTRVGVLRDNFIQDRQLSATKQFLEKVDKGLWVFFDMAEKINRGGAYFGAKSRALAKGKSEAEAIKEGVEMASKTQFTFGSVDTPVALQGDVAKTLLQFQSYNVKQAEFLTELVKNKQYGGMLRWAGANMVLVYALGELIGYDFVDAIPFSGVATGETKIGQTPAIKLVTDVGKMALGGTDKYGNPIGASQIGKDIIPLIPAGVQINKTIQGINTVNRGYVQSKSGRAYPNIIDQTTGNYLKGAFFGKSSLPNVRKQYADKMIPLGEKDTEAIKMLDPQSRKAYVEQVMQRRETDRLENEFRDFLKGDKKKSNVELLTSKGGVKYGFVNNKVIYQDEDGSTASISTDFNVEQLQLTGNKELDKKLISGYKGDITRKKNDIVKLYELGVLTDQQAEFLLNGLDAQYTKVGGGSPKSKSPRLKGVRNTVKINNVSTQPYYSKSPLSLRVKKSTPIQLGSLTNTTNPVVSATDLKALANPTIKLTPY